MKREVKFRAWRGEYFGMLYDVIKYYCLQDFIDQDMPIMQCIGLKDKTGAEIYEGDIVKCICREGSFVAVVEFGNPNGSYSWGWQLKRIRGHAFNPDILLWVETELDHVTCEVIGNVYETPEQVHDGRRMPNE